MSVWTIFWKDIRIIFFAKYDSIVSYDRVTQIMQVGKLYDGSRQFKAQDCKVSDFLQLDETIFKGHPFGHLQTLFAASEVAVVVTILFSKIRLQSFALLSFNDLSYLFWNWQPKRCFYVMVQARAFWRSLFQTVCLYCTAEFCKI